jgi:hypothetical protein
MENPVDLLRQPFSSSPLPPPPFCFSSVPSCIHVVPVPIPKLFYFTGLYNGHGGVYLKTRRLGGCKMEAFSTMIQNWTHSHSSALVAFTRRGTSAHCQHSRFLDSDGSSPQNALFHWQLTNTHMQSRVLKSLHLPPKVPDTSQFAVFLFVIDHRPSRY